MSEIRDLKKYREKIDKIDDSMADLFLERMNIARQIGHYKALNGLDIFDPIREEKLKSRRLQIFPDSGLKDYYLSFLSHNLTLSKLVQKELIEEENNINMNFRLLHVKSSKGAYPVYVCSNKLNELASLFNLLAANSKKRKVMILIDENIEKNAIDSLKSGIGDSYFEIIPSGEKSKSFSMLEKLAAKLLDLSFDRHDILISVGGGVVSDLTGFLASIYMRGIDYYNIPTSLLAQIDASIGGKTAINFKSSKNPIGSFYPPKGVFIDTSFLKTLAEEELRSGIAELIKMAACFDPDLFKELEEGEIMLNPEYFIYRGLEIKKRVVEMDEDEKSLRAVLNFGHTIGHAIESLSKIKHGYAVSIGMTYMTGPNFLTRLKNLLKKYKLPTSLEDAFPINKNNEGHEEDHADMVTIKEKILNLIEKDKKKNDDKISAILLKDIASYEIRELGRSNFMDILDNKGGYLF